MKTIFLLHDENGSPKPRLQNVAGSKVTQRPSEGTPGCNCDRWGHPSAVQPDKEGKPYTVRYEAVNAMLPNEFLKEHRIVQEQGATIARQQKQIEALTAGLQKVSAQLELSKSAPQTVLNNR